MSAVYRPSAKWRRFYEVSALAWAGVALAGFHWGAPYIVGGMAGCILSAYRARLHAQRIVLTPTCLICHTRFAEQRLPYRQIGRMRFSRLTGDLLLEKAWVCIRIPRRYEGGEEILRAVSLAVWAHRGGDVPPDLAEAGSAFR